MHLSDQLRLNKAHKLAMLDFIYVEYARGAHLKRASFDVHLKAYSTETKDISFVPVL